MYLFVFMSTCVYRYVYGCVFLYGSEYGYSFIGLCVLECVY